MVAKYLKMGLTEFKKIYEYKLDIIGKILKIPIGIIILIIIWQEIFSATNSQTIAGLDKREFFTYIIIARFISAVKEWWNVYEATQKYIVQGGLTNILSRPLKTAFVIFSKFYPHYIIEGTIMIASFFALSILSQYFGMQFFFPEMAYLILFVASLALALIGAFIFYYMISLLMFWVGDVWSLYGIFDGIEFFFSGGIIPLTITSQLNKIAYFLPFRHFVFTPSFIYLQKFAIIESIMQIGMQLGWIIILSLIAKFIYSKGLKKFDSQGG